MPAQQAADPFAALGDEHRRTILRLLSEGGKPVVEIARAMPISRPAVSRHLAVLKGAGLVVEERQGTRRLYRLHDEGVSAVRAYLEQIWGDAANRFRLAAQNTAQNTARNTARNADE